MNPNFEKLTPKIEKAEVKNEQPSFVTKARDIFLKGAMGVTMMMGTESQAQTTTFDAIKPIMEMSPTKSMQNLIDLERVGDTSLDYQEASEKVVSAFEAMKLDTLTEVERNQISNIIHRSDLFKNTFYKLEGEKGLDALQTITGMSELEVHQLGDTEVIADNIRPLSESSDRVKFVVNLLNVVNASVFPNNE